MSESSGKAYLVSVGRRVTISHLVINGWEAYLSAGEYVAAQASTGQIVRSCGQYHSAPLQAPVSWDVLPDRALARIARAVEKL